MEEIIIHGFIVYTYNIKYKRKKHLLFKLTNSVTFAQLLMLHACVKVQKSKTYIWVVLEEKNDVNIFGSIEIPFLIYQAS